MNTPDPGHYRFDLAARAAHADALAHVSAATMAQLHRRRHAALASTPARGWRWPLPAAAFASLLVVAVGLGFGLRMADEAPTVPAAPALAAAGAEPGIEAVLDDLDQNPDFYVWLASGDAPDREGVRQCRPYRRCPLLALAPSRRQGPAHRPHAAGLGSSSQRTLECCSHRARTLNRSEPAAQAHARARAPLQSMTTERASTPVTA